MARTEIQKGTKMSSQVNRPFATSPMAKFLERRINELSSYKAQRELAAEMGFSRPNILSMFKSGETKVPLERVPAMAKVLDADPKHMFRMAIDQHYRGSELTKVFSELFGNTVSDREMEWVEFIRDLSDNSDPYLGDAIKQSLREVLEKHFDNAPA